MHRINNGFLLKARVRVHNILLGVPRAWRLAEYMPLRDAWRLRRLLHQKSGPTELVYVQLRGWPRPFALRPEDSDAAVVWHDVLGRSHLPHRSDFVPNCIIDLGANVGFTMGDFARRFPDATIIGLELDRQTAELCRLNIRGWGTRCAVFNKAVWSTSGTVEFETGDGSWSTKIVRLAPHEGRSLTASAVSMDDFMEELALDVIDYVKMDIEGAEAEILSVNTGWTQRVRSMSVEVHDPYTIEQCVLDLRNLGFEIVRRDRSPSFVYAHRDA